MLKIDKNTDYLKGLFPFESSLAKGEAEKLMDAAARDLYGEGGFAVMPLRDLFAIFDGDVACLLQHDGTTAFDVYRVKGCRVYLERLITNLEALTLQPTADELKWQAGTVKVDFEPAIRIFCRDFFGLHNFKDVDDLTVTDILIAKQAAYNHAVVERNIANGMKTKGAK